MTYFANNSIIIIVRSAIGNYLEWTVITMKIKHILWMISGIVAIVAMAAGIAVLIDRFVTRKECPDGYIDCGEEELLIEE